MVQWVYRHDSVTTSLLQTRGLRRCPYGRRARGTPRGRTVWRRTCFPPTTSSRDRRSTPTRRSWACTWPSDTSTWSVSRLHSHSSRLFISVQQITFQLQIYQCIIINPALLQINILLHPTLYKHFCINLTSNSKTVNDVWRICYCWHLQKTTEISSRTDTYRLIKLYKYMYTQTDRHLWT